MPNLNDPSVASFLKTTAAEPISGAVETPLSQAELENSAALSPSESLLRALMWPYEPRDFPEVLSPGPDLTLVIEYRTAEVLKEVAEEMQREPDLLLREISVEMTDAYSSGAITVAEGLAKAAAKLRRKKQIVYDACFSPFLRATVRAKLETLPFTTEDLAHAKARVKSVPSDVDRSIAQEIASDLRNDLTQQAQKKLFEQDNAIQPSKSEDDGNLWLARAMLLIRQHPDRSDKRIAAEVGVHPSTLSRSREYKAAKALAQGDRGDARRGFETIDKESGLRDVVAVSSSAGTRVDQSDRGNPIPVSKYFREYCSECNEPIAVTPDKVGKNPICDDCSD